MRPIKILVTAPNLITGGAEKQLIYVIEGLLARGFEIVLFLLTLEGEYLDLVPKGIKILTPETDLPRKFKGFWKIKEITKAIFKEKPDLLYSRLWPTKVATAFAGFLSGKKVVFSEDRSLIRLMDESRAWKGALDLYVKKKASKIAKVIVPVSKGIADELEQDFKLNPEKIKLIYNGFDLSEMRKKAADEVSHPWFNNRKEPVIGALGRMVELKGFQYLIESVRIVNDEGIPVRLLMIGKGEFLEELRLRSERLGIKDRVEFLGFVENPFAYLARCDLFVLSSLYEGLPSTLIEAMALGLPVISTRCPTGPNEIIEDGRNGLLVPVADSKAIARAIIRVLKDRDLHKRLSVEGRKRSEDFSLEKMVSQFTEMFINICR